MLRFQLLQPRVHLFGRTVRFPRTYPPDDASGRPLILSIQSTTLSPTLSATESQGTPRVNTGTETVTVTITPSNPYDPEVTTVTETTTVTDGGEGGGDDGGDGGGSSPSTPVVAGIVGACLGALCLALVAVAAWMTKRKKDCERELNDIKGNNNGYNGTEGAPPTSAGYKEASGTT